MFGGRGTLTVASNYQLLGVVAAKKDGESVAILGADWVMQLIKPALRAVTAPPQAEQAQIDVSLAAGLRGAS